MTINVIAITEEEFDQLLKSFLVAFEGSKPLPYIDTANKATIGIGFNMQVASVRNKVFDAMGI